MLRDGECRFEIKIEGELPVLVAGEATAASGDTAVAVAVAGVAMAAMVVTLSALSEMATHALISSVRRVSKVPDCLDSPLLQLREGKFWKPATHAPVR